MRVLVVDDDEGARDSFYSFFQSAGHRCRTARAGIEALEVLETYHPDPVVADQNMPGMSGIELIRHIRTEYPELNEKVILVSAQPLNLSDLQYVTELQIDRVIKKPIQGLELRRILNLNR